MLKEPARAAEFLVRPRPVLAGVPKEYELSCRDRIWRCAVGRGGIAEKKCEGDGVTPLGSWPVRQLYYRPDRWGVPTTRLEFEKLDPSMGWCDAPEDPNYNRLVALPYRGRHERLWREDHIYDLVIVLGFNDDPVVAGKGSAIFLHLARSDYSATEGCVALLPAHLQELLGLLEPGSLCRIET